MSFRAATIAALRATLVSTAGLGACTPGGEPAPQCEVAVSLVDQARWEPVDVSADPWAADDAAAGAELCGSDALYYEPFGGAPSWTVDTKFCNWATLQQPALHEVTRAEEIHVRVWHTEQAPSGAVGQAHVAVGAHQWPMWEAAAPLPIGKGGLLSGSFAAPLPIAEGDALRWHVDNHGYNSWNMLEFSVTRWQDCVNHGDRVDR